MTFLPRCFVVLVLLLATSSARAEPPRPVDSRLSIELVVGEPDIVTPTGIAVDERGRVWVIENNTHERPPTYQGPASDRVRVFELDARSKVQRVHTFAESFRYAMGLALGPEGTVFLATRSDIYRLRDTNGDGVADERRIIVRLDSTANYPHNGLAGFALDALGDLYFGLGENLGAPYKLIGSDGVTLSGGGEGGSIYRCRSDGSGLTRIATGFWNPFHQTFDALGRLFAVDNDPDSRGPCRLLHIISGGDYGYRFRNGRKGLHPFTAWNGELPGTLPMVAGTGEAPCGVLAYESNGLPADYRGELLVTSWGDHVIERFRLAPRGASVTSQARAMIRGGEDFRPVGIAQAPDGSLYVSDWVDKSYPVHGKGRIWRIRWKDAPADDDLRASQVAKQEASKFRRLLGHPRPEIRAAARDALSHQGDAGKEPLGAVLATERDPRLRLQALWGAARLQPRPALDLVAQALNDKAPEVRAEAAHVLGQLRPTNADQNEGLLLQCALNDPAPAVRLQAILSLRARASLEAAVPMLADPDPFLAMACLAVLGRPENTPLLLAQATSPDAKRRLGVLLALRRAGGPEGRALLPRFLADENPDIRRAAIQWVGEERLSEFGPLLRNAAARPPVSRELLEAILASRHFLAGERCKPADEVAGEEYVAEVVQDTSQPPALRALALRMLRPDHKALSAASLRLFLANADPNLRREAARTLALRDDEPSQDLLRRLVADGSTEPTIRAEAILGLAHSAPTSPATRHLLFSLLGQTEFRRDILRSLRDASGSLETEQALLAWWKKEAARLRSEDRKELANQLVLALRPSKRLETLKALSAILPVAGPRPADDATWQAFLDGPGDAAAGERVFFHARGPRCFSCHRLDGRGAAIGPDLSAIGRSSSREKLVESILTPSKEIAPSFVSWMIATRDGRVWTGMIVEEGPNSTVTLADAQGKLKVIPRNDIEERRAVPSSIMPDHLADLMTPQEFRDLIAYLRERR